MCDGKQDAGFDKRLAENVNISKSDCDKACEIISAITKKSSESGTQDDGEQQPTKDGGASMETKHLWHLNCETRGIIEAVALEFNGYVIKTFLFPKGEMAICSDTGANGGPWADFKLNASPYFLRSQLFGYQRLFGKWGGEMVPEWDRSYSHWYFTYLQCYRDQLTSLFKVRGNEAWVGPAVKREEAAADLRLNFSLLGNDDMTELSMDELEAAMRGDFTLACERGLPTYIANRAVTLLANACNHETILRMMDPDTAVNLSQKEMPMDKVNFARIRAAFSQYIKRGVVDEDDAVNRVIYKMLQWFLTTHPGHEVYANRSYILYGLMYLHLYRKEFLGFDGIPDRVKKWRKEPRENREHWAAQFRQHLSILREASSMLWEYE